MTFFSNLLHKLIQDGFGFWGKSLWDACKGTTFPVSFFISRSMVESLVSHFWLGPAPWRRGGMLHPKWSYLVIVLTQCTRWEQFWFEWAVIFTLYRYRGIPTGASVGSFLLPCPEDLPQPPRDVYCYQTHPGDYLYHFPFFFHILQFHLQFHGLLM